MCCRTTHLDRPGRDVASCRSSAKGDARHREEADLCYSKESQQCRTFSDPSMNSVPHRKTRFISRIRLDCNCSSGCRTAEIGPGRDSMVALIRRGLIVLEKFSYRPLAKPGCEEPKASEQRSARFLPLPPIRPVLTRMFRDLPRLIGRGHVGDAGDSIDRRLPSSRDELVAANNQRAANALPRIAETNKFDKMSKKFWIC